MRHVQRYTDAMSAQCCASVADDGPTSVQCMVVLVIETPRPDIEPMLVHVGPRRYNPDPALCHTVCPPTGSCAVTVVAFF